MLALAAGLVFSAAGQEGGLFADFETSHGSFTCRLYFESAPRTVANFIGLATGERTWLDLNRGMTKNDPFYDGLTFHRVIDGFMIQGGSPNGLGTDHPGYAFPDEFDPLLLHDGPGVLSMANSGPDSNGAQFFITLAETSWLDGRHSVFGRVETGMDSVAAIGAVETDGDDRPLTPVVVHSVTIRRVGDAAQAFDAAGQKLPVVRNLRLGIAGGAENIFLAFPRRARARYFLFGTEDLTDTTWDLYDLGLEGAVPEPDGQAVDVAGIDRLFFSMAEILYPAAPASLLDRTLTLDFDFGESIIVDFDGAGGGTYTYVGHGSGAVSGYDWYPEIYHGYLWPIHLDGLAPLYIRLTPLSDEGGTFVDYAGDDDGNPVPRYTGTFTLSP